MNREQEKLRDARLVKRGLAGDREALTQLVDHYYLLVFKVAKRILGDDDASSDVTQSTFVSVFEKLDTFDDRYKFFSWIYRITVNHALAYRKGPQLVNLEESGPEGPESTEAAPDELRAEQEFSAMIERSLLGLPENYRVVLVMRHFAELSYDDIAQVLEVPAKTVRSRLYSARQLMKSQLESQGIN